MQNICISKGAHRQRMNRKITILIDLDDTMTHLSRSWCKWLNDKYGTSVSNQDIQDWNMAKYFPELEPSQVFEPLHEDLFWKNIEPIDGAIEYIEKLIDEGFNVYICTASVFDTIKSKFECVISKYFPFISWDQVIVTSNKQLVNGDILIDDGVHNLEGGTYKKILMSAPHNESYDAESNGMTRVKTWEEAYYVIHKHVEEKIREDKIL